MLQQHTKRTNNADKCGANFSHRAPRVSRALPPRRFPPVRCQGWKLFRQLAAGMKADLIHDSLASWLGFVGQTEGKLMSNHIYKTGQHLWCEPGLRLRSLSIGAD